MVATEKLEGKSVHVYSLSGIAIIQGDSKLLSGVSWPINGNHDNNLESLFISVVPEYKCDNPYLESFSKMLNLHLLNRPSFI
jgi:hypothetical protein